MICDASQEAHLFLKLQLLDELLRFFIEPALAAGQCQHGWSTFFLLCLVESLDQADMIFTRLKCANAKYQGVLQAIFMSCSSQQDRIGDAVKIWTHAIGNNNELLARRLKVRHQGAANLL